MSKSIRLQNLYFTYSNLTDEIISGINADFNQGWTSLCGANGCGKTTLLKLISGELSPDSGFVAKKGRLVEIAQSTEFAPAGLSKFKHDFQRKSIKLRDLLGICDDWFDRWDSISIGERKRMQIAVALSSEPDILLVDEPSNHIDADTRRTILKVLKEFRGIAILISHDRLLLNELCDHTAFLDSGELQIFSASYDEAKSEQLKLRLNAQSEKDKYKKEQAKNSKSMQLQTEKIDKGKGKLSKRGLDKKDHDTKEKINRAKLFGADLSDSRKKQVLGRKGEKISAKINDIKVKKEYNLGVFFEKIPKPRNIHFDKKIIKNEHLNIDQSDIYIEAGEKLAITGNNGAGKSTLLKSWLEIFPCPYAYAPQEFSSQETKALSEKISKLDREELGKIMTLVSCLGSNPKSIAEGSLPSPGVWQKLVIAQAIIDAVPLLILDEPTNHMDLPAVEILEEALREYKGTLICISHDDKFLSRVCKRNLKLVKHEKLTRMDFL